MIKWRQMFEGVRALRAGQLGDGAVLKADAFGTKASPAVEARLERVRGYLPRIDLDALDGLPPGSFGVAFAEHMRKNKLTPFAVSDRIPRDMLERNAFHVRYAVTHDIFHLLLGFGTDWAGEMGVLAFATAQRYARSQWIALVLAAILYPLFAPRQTLRIYRALARGYRLGKKARLLIAEPFEERWSEPLSDVRRSLGIPDPDHAEAHVLQPAAG